MAADCERAMNGAHAEALQSVGTGSGETDAREQREGEEGQPGGQGHRPPHPVIESVSSNAGPLVPSLVGG